MTRKPTPLLGFAMATAFLISASFAAEQAKTTRTASSPSAFQLAKEGNRYIGEEAKDKVVQIRSERSKGGITPSVWYVVYLDNTTELKATEVKFGNGRMLDVNRPLRLLSATASGTEPLPMEKLKVDSDQALKVASKQQALEGITLKSSEMRLQRDRKGEPVWRIRLWAADPKVPDSETSIGDIVVATVDGNVIENDLKPAKAR